MNDAPAGDPRDRERPLQLLEELRTLIRQQADAQHAAMTEHIRLRRVIEDTATRLEGMLAGQRASRAELQALIDTLRAAVAPPPPTHDDEG